ncbi:MAG: class I SAM-dependent methyltransferase [Planctomycetota bacterium]|jgi:SAM-dependent methyltransferase|nr:class I SAM-dependent methyltransferase [Planctomycetota bacterium]
MSNLTGPVTDWDLVHRWEWFRRESWRRGFRAAIHGQGGGPARAFADLAHATDAKALLDASCGLGRRAILLSEKGVNVMGSDLSGTAVNHARELAKDESASVTFFRSAWNDLPKNMPHHFDGILLTGLSLEPSWDNLGTSLVGIFHALQPGGFLMFVGATENEPRDTPVERVEKEWSSQPPERVEWFFRDGRVSCFLLKTRSRAADYIDDRLYYASEENGEIRLESTIIRRPAYWTWLHWCDLSRMAGFSHLETRSYPGYGLDGGDLRINVAWKAKGSAEAGVGEGQAPGEEYSD